MDTKKHTLCDSIYCSSKAGKTKVKKIRAMVASRWGDYLERDTKELSGKMEIFYTMIKVYPLVKIVQLKSAHLIVYKSYLNVNCIK